jgi:hypothetical protein
VADELTEPTNPEPVVEPMPEASTEPVSTVTPPLFGGAAAHRSYKSRFAVVYVLLGALVVGAAAFFAVVVTGGSSPTGPAWSPWKPKGGSQLDEAGQIASHVSPLYRVATGGPQLVVVKASRPEVQNISVEEVALKTGAGSSDYRFVSTKDAVVYQLCGLGSRCAIKNGTPSQERARLLRREALELALYTFKYVDGVNAVIALIPPPANDPNTNWALFFQKKDFDNQLSHPLGQTLPTPSGGKRLVPDSVVGNQDERTVEKLTRPYWFTSTFTQAQDGNAILVLDPIAVTG